nr:capsid triplex subunit 2 [Salmonid herpesvirus 1]
MEAPKITFRLDNSWLSRNSAPVPLAGAIVPLGQIPHLPHIVKEEVNVPAGIFITTRGGNYHPTAHGGSETYINRAPMALTTEGNSLARVMSAYYTKGGGYTMINTGAESLKAGDYFTVNYPSAADIAAQLACVENIRTQTSCGGIQFPKTKPLWGGFLATQKVASSVVAEMTHRLQRDNATPGSATLTALCDIHHSLQELIPGARAALEQEWLNQHHVPNNPNPNPNHVPNLQTLTTPASIALVRAIIKSCGDLFAVDNLRTFGVCNMSSYANPSSAGKGRSVTSALDGCTKTGSSFIGTVFTFQGIPG